MKYLTIMFSILFVLSCNPSATKDDKGIDLSIDIGNTPSRVLRHVVMFKFKDDAALEAIKEVETAFAALQNTIPEIRDYEWGKNNSPEGLSKGFTHCFVVTFHSEEDREVYLPHPDHQAFVKLLGPVLEDPFVLDYWTEE